MKRKSAESLLLLTSSSCSRIPALVVFSLVREESLAYKQTIALPGNLLDIAFSASSDSVIFSIDNACPPFQRVVSSQKDELQQRNHICSIRHSDSKGLWEINYHDDLEEPSLGIINAIAKSEISTKVQGFSNDLLYNLESLRKKPGNDNTD